MSNIYQHTLRYSDIANARPTFQSHLEIAGFDPNLNRTTKRYYSSQDVSIFFGDFYIDDASFIEFEVTESAMLLYGYNSYVFDDMAKGARMVQGRFAINFTQSNYLSKVMSDISVHKGTGAITHSRYHALWPTGFDLFVHHGSVESGDLELVTLHEIYITGCSMAKDSKTGQPIGEVYTFVGKDVRFGEEVQPQTPSQPTEEATAPIPELKISSFGNEITLDFGQYIEIDKATYAFDEDNKFTSKNIRVNNDSIVIAPDKDEVNEWAQDHVYVKILVYHKNETTPIQYEETLMRK